ncbi:hypothetical protein QFZ94_003357 [Paraburkholderia sp. JPY465]|uniref:hypothetical protein n=1 Tax=Paraburkholderia sp. JPY465 TaxID=3042285 RepID=UPI003D19F1A8
MQEIKQERNQMTEKRNTHGGARPGAGRKPKAKPTETESGGNKTTSAPNRRGGARPGAGRKPMDQRHLAAWRAVAPADDPKAFLLSVMNNAELDPASRIEAAQALMPYYHPPLAAEEPNDE